MIPITPCGSAQEPAGLGFHSKTAVRHRLFAQKVVGVLDAKTSGVQDDKDFGEQRFNRWFPGLAGDQVGDFRYLLM